MIARTMSARTDSAAPSGLQEPAGEMTVGRVHVGSGIGGDNPADAASVTIFAPSGSGTLQHVDGEATTMTTTPMATTRPMTQGHVALDVARTAPWPRPGMPKTSFDDHGAPQEADERERQDGQGGPPGVPEDVLGTGRWRSGTPRRPGSGPSLA